MTRVLLLAIAILLVAASAQANNTIITTNIANAPGRQNTHSYAGGNNLTSDRVLAGPGYVSSTGVFTNGTAVYLWIDTTPGSATSGSNDTSFAGTPCPSPGTSTVTDGGITWECLVLVDYNTLSGYLMDDVLWSSGASHLYNDYVVSDSPPKIYRATPTQTTGCTSGNAAPTGTGSSISDHGTGAGTCLWDFFETLAYSSQRLHIPKETWPTCPGRAVVNMLDYYVGQIWYGGVSRQEYVGGANGENDPPIAMAHWDAGENNPNPQCTNNDEVPPSPLTGTGTTFPTAFTTLINWSLICAPQDCFAANPNKNSNALEYNSANGVSIHGTSAAAAQTGFYNVMDQGSGLASLDVEWPAIIGLQIKSDNFTALDGYFRGLTGTFVYDDILDGPGFATASQSFTTYGDGGPTFLQDVIIKRGTDNGGAAVGVFYPSGIYSSTIINLGTGSDTVCASGVSAGIAVGTFQNSALFGCAHPIAFAAFSGGIGGPTTLSAAITTTSRPASFTTTGQCCATQSGGGSGFEEVIIDNEIALFTGTEPGTSFPNGLGAPQYGTSSATHLNGANIAAYPYTNPTASNNAIGSTCSPTNATFTSNGNTYADIPLPGASLCGLSSASQFVNPATDFKLKSGSSLIGAGASLTITATGLFNVPYTNTLDILGNTRTSGTDIGAVNFISSATPTPQGPSVRRAGHR